MKTISIAKYFLISLPLLLTTCKPVNRIILPPTIETRVGKHAGNVNIGFHLSAFPYSNDITESHGKAVILEQLGLNANFILLKPNFPASFLLSMAEENFLGELHLYLPSKPLLPGIAINRLWATNFKSTNFSFLLNFVSDDYNIYGSVGYFRTLVEINDEQNLGKVFSSNIGVNRKLHKNVGFFIAFSYFDVLSGLKGYDEVSGNLEDVHADIKSVIYGLYMEF